MADTIGKFKLQPAPPLSVPAKIPFEPPPPLSVPRPVPFEPPPKLGTPMPVQPLEPAPALSVPARIGFEPAPPLSVPAVIPFEPAPPLAIPPAVPFEPAPPLSVPAQIGPEPAPPLSVPAAVPFEPPPALSVPAKIGPEPAPPLSVPRRVPFEPAPPLSVPAAVDEPVTFKQPRPHSEVVLAEEAKHNTIPGIISDITSDALNALKGIPGQVLRDLGIPTSLDIHLGPIARGIADAEIAKGTKKATALIENGLRRALPGAFKPSPSLLDIPGTPREQQTQPFLQDFSATVPDNGGQPSETSLPDLRVEDRDSEHDFASQNREFNQGEQELAAGFLDRDLRTNSRADDNKLTQLFNDRASRSGKSLSVSFGGLRTAGNALPASFRSLSGVPEQRGFFLVDAKSATTRAPDVPSDDDAYVPLVFTDLRSVDGRHFRSVYFRPFIKSLSESFAPQWSMHQYWGRVDPMATYQGTNRQVQLSFKLVAFSPEDLKILYQKLGWLTSMVYPQYSGGSYFRGPVVRMRVGDLINAVGRRDGNRGLPGVITQLDVNYDDTVWELDADQKVPKYIEVSLGFHVLHEFPIGVSAGGRETKFGGIGTGPGARGQKSAYVDVGRFRDAFGGDYLNDAKEQTVNPPSPTPELAGPADHEGNQ